jgi:uncharacterized membrane protein
MSLTNYIRPHHITMIAIIAAITLAGYLLIPAQTSLPVHWNIFGQPDAFLPRTYALLILPAAIFAMLIVTTLVMRFTPDTRSESGKYVGRASITALLLLFGAIQTAMVLIGYGVAVDMARVIIYAFAVLLLILGNALPKSQPNAFAGIRVPWTLNNPTIWQAAHRIAGKLMMQGGVVLAIVATFVTSTPWLVAAFAACILVPLIAALFISYRMSKQL